MKVSYITLAAVAVAVAAISVLQPELGVAVGTTIAEISVSPTIAAPVIIGVFQAAETAIEKIAA